MRLSNSAGYCSGTARSRVRVLGIMASGCRVLEFRSSGIRVVPCRALYMDGLLL